MGACTSSHAKRMGGIKSLPELPTGDTAATSPPAGKGARSITRPSTVKIIHTDGKLQEFRQSIGAQHVLSQNPKTFLCSLESMNLNSYIEQVPETSELQLGEIYFLLPLSQSHTFLSLSDLCTLAIRASTALRKHDLPMFSPHCKNSIPADINGIRKSSQLGRGNR